MAEDTGQGVAGQPSAPAPAPDTTSVSSPATPATPEASPSPPAPDAPAPPSSAEGESKESLLSAVLKVVKPDPNADKLALPDAQTGSPPDQAKPDQPEPDAPTQEELSEDPSREEMGRYHSRTRKRIDKLLEQRNEARKEADTLRATADVTKGLREFLTANDIQKEDFGVLLDLGVALRKGDFRTFYAGVRPYMDLAEEALGLKVSDDLAMRVQQGHLTTEQARAFTAERIARQLAESQALRAAQIQQAQTQSAQRVLDETQTAALQRSVATAVNNWEAGMRTTDPDFAHKADAVKNFLWAVVQEQGPPQNPAQAVAVANEAYRRANEYAARFAPRPRPTPAVPSSVNRGGNGAVAEPKSLMEAAMLGLQRSRRSA